MTTLNQIISDLDDRLIQEEKLLHDIASPNLVFGDVEEMRKYVLVQIDDQRIAIPIDGLAEIGPMPVISKLPNLPAWILGIANQRGEIISVIDLNLLMNDSVNGIPKKGKRLAVLRSGSMRIGISIDKVIATISRPQSDRVKVTDSKLAKAEPEVFGNALNVDKEIFQILQTGPFMDMERLMQYYLTE